MWCQAYDVIIFFLIFLKIEKNGWLGFSQIAYDPMVEIHQEKL